jgi:hypothetical protein
MGIDRRPPKPRLVLRVGVSGHLPNKFLPEAQDIVRRRLIDQFAELRTKVEALHKANTQFFDGTPPELRIVSALAEGADRIVAEAGLENGFGLDVVLPFPPDLYESDFETQESKDAFRKLLGRNRSALVLDGTKADEDRGPEKRAYEAGGLVVLRQCDVLISVWDGEEAAGRGGTGRIVQRAVEIGRPVLRFDEKGQGPFVMARKGAAAADAGDLAQSAPPLNPARLDDLVQQLCAPPGTRPGQHGKLIKAEQTARRHLERFLSERERRFALLAAAYPLMVSLLAWKKWSWSNLRCPAYLASTEAEWREYWASLQPVGAAVCDPLRRILMTRFAWADKLANFYGQFHRSGYVTNYAFSAMAVLFATIAAMQDGNRFEPFDIPKLIELVLIMAVVGTTTTGWIRGWHPRWLEYRQLSTLLRHQRALFLTGSSTPDARSPHADEVLHPGTIWVNWYYRMTMRELGLIDVAIDPRYLATARQAIGVGEVRDQVAYHAKNERRMRAVGRWLDVIGVLSFGLTLVACLFEVLLPVLEPHISQGIRLDWLRGLSIVLPAVGAATFGIRIQGDFEGSAERSDRMARSLGAIAGQIQSTDALSFAQLSSLTENAVATMAEEIDDWGFVYRARPLALPT